MIEKVSVGTNAPSVRNPLQWRFQTLEIGRGIAAAMVALSHAVGLCAEDRWYGVVPFGGKLINMDVGVDFFFVLSGFIITFVHWQDFGRPERCAHYASRRFSRIYPPYWIILTAIVPIYLLMPTFGKPSQHDWISILTSYLLVPMPEQPVLGVAWTLTYEMFFYIMLGVAILFGRRAAPLYFVWLVLIVACQILGLHDYPFSFFGSTFCVEFLIGMVVAMCLRRASAPLPGVLLGLGVTVFFSAALFDPDIQLPAHGAWARLLFGTASAFIIAGSVELERSERIAVPAWLLPLGAASYAIYLTHVVTESALLRGLMRFGFGTIDARGTCIILAATGIAGGIMYHFWIERPLTRIVRLWLP